MTVEVFDLETRRFEGSAEVTTARVIGAEPYPVVVVELRRPTRSGRDRKQGLMMRIADAEALRAELTWAIQRARKMRFK